MLETLRNAFKIKDVRRRIYYVLLMLVIVRIGSQLPIPGVDRDFFKNLFASQSNDAFNFFNAFTGGSFEQMSIFALSITPYITSSIIIQLLTIAIPKLEEMQRDGEEGRKKMTAITRYLTVGLALFRSVAMVIGFGNRGWLTEMNFTSIVVAVVTLTGGSAMLMWIGEQITEKGVGNGISIVLMINIVSRIPSDLASLFEKFVKGNTIARGGLAAIIILAIIVLVVVLVLILNGGERKIPVQYSKKMVGRKMMGGQSSAIPLKVNTAGVIPIIFASSLMSFPVVIASFLGKGGGTGIGSKILKGLTSSNWFNPNEPVYSVGLVVYIVLVIFFAYFYTSITFNPMEVADNMKKQGGFVPGIRPGKPTQEYLEKILSYIIFIGATGLVIVAVIPFFFNGVFGANVSFGGTSIIIVVGVVLETIKQVESRMLVRNYKGFLSE
ncbi:preprotein translocase subunit SecY [Blautia pseudococcoides]|uniref:Protein translocase subunit SecY n=1 Tax=Blautia pseudococcoides TaxID=1796616 RepID=A0A1C7IDF1_9FIRM|nr:preprotein translocase subunit SecY [Blautia pseudococcoides]ANU77038.1 preprotein translocase subunit SecY [Blautia pseudococcoides]ASU29836.1 preprotein translocase subunit SecY [Blautia pseudococcoides]QQQ94611.1 preprotein translocase subunit SecY [Blautia pseudococcoides]